MIYPWITGWIQHHRMSTRRTQCAVSVCNRRNRAIRVKLIIFQRGDLIMIETGLVIFICSKSVNVTTYTLIVIRYVKLFDIEFSWLVSWRQCCQCQEYKTLRERSYIVPGMPEDISSDIGKCELKREVVSVYLFFIKESIQKIF